MLLAEDLGPAGSNGEPALGRTAGCVIWLASSSEHSLLGYVQAHPRDRQVAATFCRLVVHELAHTAGLTFSDNPADPAHSPDPNSVMAAGGGDPPWACRVWARDRATRVRSGRRV
jgi:hypothetical protein